MYTYDIINFYENMYIFYVFKLSFHFFFLTITIIKI